MFRKISEKEMIKNEELRSKSMESGLNERSQDLGIELSEREIQEIIQGQQISELEIMIIGGIRHD